MSVAGPHRVAYSGVDLRWKRVQRAPSVRETGQLTPYCQDSMLPDVLGHVVPSRVSLVLRVTPKDK